MSIVNTASIWYLKNRIPRMLHVTANPVEVQYQLLMGLIEKSRNTAWGKKYEYTTIRSYNEFRNRVPLQDYEHVKPWVERMIKGEQQLLWPTEIRWFAKSSGTTSERSKFIPVSPEALHDCHYKAGKDVLSLYYRHHPDTQMFDGKGLIMGGSHKVSDINQHVRSGDLSAVLLQNTPLFGRFFRAPELSLALLDNWEEKLDKVAHATYAQNITSVSGVPSWNLMLMKRILEITGRNHMLEVWPKLELFVHGGVSFAPYQMQFEKIIPSGKMHYLETYNASEGFFGIQDQPDVKEMLLMLDHGIFYEFIPMNEIDQPNPRAIPLEEVSAETNYAMVITTNAGLWRYMIGDTVKFTSTAPYRLKITGRTKSFINAFGEEVMVDNTDMAIQEACRQTGAIISEYTAAPIYLKDNQSAAHEYIIEFEHKPSDINLFGQILDKKLQEVNSDYEAKRSGDLMLKKPKVISVPRHTFFRWLKSKGRIGGQNKVPRLYNNRKYIDDILDFISS